MTVGIARILYSAASSACSSTSTVTRCALVESLGMTALMTEPSERVSSGNEGTQKPQIPRKLDVLGPSTLQGGHHLRGHKLSQQRVGVGQDLFAALTSR